MWIGKSSDSIGKILSPALRLWLRSQVEAVEELQFQIQGRDGQILKGHVPEVFLSSRQAVYQGLHLGDLKVRGENIRINIGQVLKGKPLQLLEPIQVMGEVRLSEADLQVSLASPILSGALSELLAALLELKGVGDSSQFLEGDRVRWDGLTLHPDKFALTGTLSDSQGKASSVHIEAGLTSIDSQALRLAPIHLEILPDGWNGTVPELEIDLGSDVGLDALSLDSGQLFCCGRLVVRP